MADSEDFPRQTVLVLGAAGFVGSRLTEALAHSVEFRPIAGLRRPRRAGGAGVEIRHCDATDPRAVARALTGVDFVVNCVAGGNHTLIDATRTLCDAARRTPPRRIVHLSSMAVYGAATGPVAEDTPPRAPLSGYGEAKRLCEALIHDYVRDGGDAVILRPGCIFGPGSAQWTIRIARLLRARRIGDLGAAGDGTCNLTYIDDLVQAIVTALKTPNLAGAVFNVADPAPVTWNEFLTAFGRALGATPIRRLPHRRIAVETRLVAPLLRIAAIVARGARLPAHRIPEAITPSLAALFRQDVRLLTDAAATRLNLAHTPLERAIDVSARWLDPRSRTAPPGKAACCDQKMEVGRS